VLCYDSGDVLTAVQSEILLEIIITRISRNIESSQLCNACMQPAYVSVTYAGCTSKGKAAPLQAWSGPEGSMKLRFPDFMTTA